MNLAGEESSPQEPDVMVLDQEKITAPIEIEVREEQVEVAKDTGPVPASPVVNQQQENVAMQIEQPVTATTAVAAAPTLALNHSAALLAILSDMNVNSFNNNTSEEQKDRLVQDSYQAAANIISNTNAAN